METERPYTADELGDVHPSVVRADAVANRLLEHLEGEGLIAPSTPDGPLAHAAILRTGEWYRDALIRAEGRR
jgi:hypothetical protein